MKKVYLSMCIWEVDIKFPGYKVSEFQSKTNLAMQNCDTYGFWFWVVNKFSTCDCVCGCLFRGYFGAWMETGGWKLTSNHQDPKIYGCYMYCIIFSCLLCLAWHLGMLFCMGKPRHGRKALFLLVGSLTNL